MSITWLHISDFHVRSGDPYDRDVVLGALVKSAAEYRQQGRSPDLVFATGDIAHAGKPQEYNIATQFLDDLLSAVGLPKSRLFVIAGNHDVDRDLGVGLGRTLESGEQSDKYFAPERPHPHLTQKLCAFLEWHNRYFAGIREAPANSTCGPVELVELNSHRLGILPINSALFCEDDEDHAKLWIGRRCLDVAIAALKSLKADLNIALVHHPLEWLHPVEGANIQAELESSVDILLRGHLHEARIESIASPEGESLRCAAGAAYQSRKWPNRAFYATFNGSELTIYPIRYEDSPRPIWTTDPSVFPRAEGHQKSFRVPRLNQEKPSPAPLRVESTAPRFRSNIGSRGNRPFVGHDDLMERIASDLGDPVSASVVILHGQPGVGKSELAVEFARRNADRYSGGRFWVDASTDAVDIGLANIGKNILNLQFPSDLPLNDQGQQTFYSLGAAPVLLIYDNVVSFERVEKWLPLSGMPCQVLITTLADTRNLAWPCIEVEPLSPEQSQELIVKLTGTEFAARYGAGIVAQAGGLPVQIVPEATTLAYEVRRGRQPAPGSAVAREAGDSFHRAYRRLEQPARLLLHAASILNPQRIPRGELSRHMQEGAGWSESDFERALDTCLDLHLLHGTPEPSMHQLFATFLRDMELSADDLLKVRAAQRTRFVELGESVAANPADTQNATTLISYPLAPPPWEQVSSPLSIEDGGTIGRALLEIGRFEEARPWFERAVAVKEKGDVHGRIDHESLGVSLDQVGSCLSRTGRYAEARPWYERAVTAKEKGDVHGHIDHESLGSSLHQLGYCFSSTGQYAEALPLFERAVAETEKGDVHGRIDHDSLGSSLHQVGYCLSSTSQYAKALPWFERAAAAEEKGDVHGRIDHASLGISLHQLGYCLSSMCQFAEARPWCERAAAAAEKGDLHGRIDHTSLGRSLHLVGYCLSSMGQYAEARLWFERAIVEMDQGDVHGRIDHASLGRSLQLVGYCLSSMGQYAEARPWFERAVTAKEKGDVHGRINHESLSLSLRSLATCLRELGQNEEADALEKRAEAEDAHRE